MTPARSFTSLEQAVFEEICKASATLEAPLREYLASARVTKRENTGHGFFTYFETDRAHARLEWPLRYLDGPNRLVRAQGADVPMGFMLWLEDGRPDCLEGFQYGTETGTVDLTLHDLSGLVLAGEWS